MGFFDFLKKKEFQRIKELEAENASLKAEITQLQSQVSSLSKYTPLSDIDIEIENLTKKKAQAEEGLNNRLTYVEETFSRKKEVLEKDYENLKQQYSQALSTYQNLRDKIRIYQDDLEMAEFGVYQPHFNFDTSEEYKEKINAVREKQKQMIKNKTAIYGGDGISWNGSLSQGQTIVNNQKRLMMRAFNGETDSFIANVDWNNIQRMEERVEKSFEAINKVFEKQGIKIGQDYKKLKIDELRLTYEYRKKKQEEREEQRAIREQMREEERAEREIEAARINAEKEQAMYLKALEKARFEMGTAVGKKQEELLKRIAELEAGLVNAETIKQKAISMAQQTKMGYVYVISNIGSFGENVYKIGMTRRLEPMDRVRELGDASVPFYFDVHAMIFSEKASELENKLHTVFAENRLNLVNYRKEFFNVPLQRIKEEAEKFGAKVEFTMIAEAQEYRESLKLKTKPISQEAEFPNSI